MRLGQTTLPLALMAPVLAEPPASSFVPRKASFVLLSSVPAPSSARYTCPYHAPGYLVHSDHTKWRRSIEDLLKADNKSIVEMLMEDKILPDWTGFQCPGCTGGKLSGLAQQQPGARKHRCRRKPCQAYSSPHHLHALRGLWRSCFGPSDPVSSVAPQFDKCPHGRPDQDPQFGTPQPTSHLQQGTWPREPSDVWSGSQAMKHLRNRRVVIHTDSAKSYKLRLDGVLHDRVFHPEKGCRCRGNSFGRLPKRLRCSNTVCRAARSPSR